MSSYKTFESELVSIFEGLANAAVAQIIKLVNSSALALRKENDALRRSLVLMERELEAARGERLNEKALNISVELQVHDRAKVDEPAHEDSCELDQTSDLKHRSIYWAPVDSDSESSKTVTVKNECSETIEQSPNSPPHKNESLVNDPEDLFDDSETGQPANAIPGQDHSTASSLQADWVALRPRRGRPRKDQNMIDILAAKHKTMFCRGRRGKVDTSELVPELRPLKPVSYSMDFPESPCCSFEESQEWASDDRGSSSSNVNDASQNYQEVLHRCPWCLALFNDADKLKEHELCHGPFICTVCGESFPTSGAYQSHVKTHVQSKPRVRPFRCEQCGKTFTAKSSLKTHQVTHTGEQPFGCTVCGKRFSLLCNLKTHERIHRGERPFKCMECGRSFTQKHVLKRHVCV